MICTQLVKNFSGGPALNWNYRCHTLVPMDKNTAIHHDLLVPIPSKCRAWFPATSAHTDSNLSLALILFSSLWLWNNWIYIKGLWSKATNTNEATLYICESVVSISDFRFPHNTRCWELQGERHGTPSNRLNQYREQGTGLAGLCYNLIYFILEKILSLIHQSCFLFVCFCVTKSSVF